MAPRRHRSKLILRVLFAAFVFALASTAMAGPTETPSTLLDTPRRAFDTFFAAAERGDWSHAAETLDLHVVRADERKTRGPELATQLYSVFRRALWIDPDSVPDETTLKPDVTTHRLALIPLEGRDVPLTLVNVSPKGKEPRWQFSSATVSLVPRLADQYGAGPIEARLPESVTRPHFGSLALWQWIALGLALPVSVVLGRILTFLLGRFATRIVSRTRATWDDELVEELRGPTRLFTALAAFWTSLALLSLPMAAERWLETLLKIGFIGVLGFAVVRVTGVVASNIEERAAEAAGRASVTSAFRARGLTTQVRVLTRVINMCIGVLVLALMLLQFEVVRSVGMSLLASAGVVGVVLGLAAQRTIGSLIAGIQLSATQPMRIGDEVVIEKEWGIIEEITLTYVVVKVWDERRLIIPMTRFLEQPFENWTKVSAAIHGTVFLYPDPTLPVAALRTELARVLAEETLWDGRTGKVQVTETDSRAMTVRVLVSARNAGELFELRARVRERLLAWLGSFESGRYVARLRLEGDVTPRTTVPTPRLD